jgi:hypothetical protein
MDDASGIDLSLLEGMDETLLVRLHEAGVRTREDLAAALTDRAARRRLAETLQVSEQRLEILEHLNFRSPEDQTRRWLVLERRLGEHVELLARENKRLWRAVLGFAGLAAALAAVAVIAVLLRAGGGGADAEREALAERVQRLEQDLEAVRPVATSQAEDELLQALSGLGPAPGWNGPLTWTAADHRRATALFGEDEAALPERAVSLVLARLAALENAPLDSLVPLTRAREAVALLDDFPPPNGLGSAWDASAVLLRQRIRARALGLAAPDPEGPPPFAAEPWPWTAPGFLTAEELLTRLEALPVSEEALAVWSESLMGVRQAADHGRESLDGRPEAWARDYWIRRGELELAVAAALMGRGNLLPYHGLSPREFITQRRGYLERAERGAPAAARAPLAWLLVEYDEALALLAWLDGAPGRGGDVSGKRWAAALALTDAARETNGHPPTADAALTGRVEHALLMSGFSGVAEPWLHPRTSWEAGLRPLLTATRAAARSRREAVPPGP